VAAKSRRFTADKPRKGQFLRRNRSILAVGGVVRKILSPQRVASVSNLCNSRNRGQGTCVMEDVALVLASESARYFQEVQHYRRPTGSLELHGGDRVGKIPNIPEGFSLEKCWGRGEKGEGRLGVR